MHQPKHDRNFFIICLLLILIVMLSSCSPQWHLNRAIRKGPHLFEDTLVRIDTVFRQIEVPQIVEKKVFVNDTIEIVRYDSVTKDSIYARLVRLPGDTVYLELDCPDCPEITKTETVTVVETLSFWDKFRIGVFWFVLGGLIAIGYSILRRFI